MTTELSLSELQASVYEWAESKGWHNPPPTFGEAIALLHSEASEALEAFRVHGARRYVTDTRGGCHYLSDPAMYGALKPEGVPSEFADVLIRLLHYSVLWGVDLYSETVAKMAFNEGRPYRHGNQSL